MIRRPVPQAALDLAKHFEGLRLKAYVCQAGKLTIGYGHTGNVFAGQEITEAEADRLLAKDMASAASAVCFQITPEITDNQYAALCDFVFNLGSGNLVTSTLRAKINAGDMAGAADEFLRWNKARVNGELVPLPGLTKRRTAERELFLKG